MREVATKLAEGLAPKNVNFLFVVGKKDGQMVATLNVYHLQHKCGTPPFFTTAITARMLEETNADDLTRIIRFRMDRQRTVKTYQVRIKEIHWQQVEIHAWDKEDAIDRVIDGTGDYAPIPDYDTTAPQDEWTVKEIETLNTKEDSGE